MSAGARVAAFAALLVAIFAAAALAGRAIDPATDTRTARGHGHSADAHGGGEAPAARRAGAAADGLASSDCAPSLERRGGERTACPRSQSGYRLVAGRTRFATGRRAPLRLRIVDARGNTVRAFETEQARRMHLIVVRRDLRRYQHLHPVQVPDGAWTIALKLPEAGVYRAFADFRIGGSQHVLGIDLFAPGQFTPLELPKRDDSASVDGYDVALHAYGADELTFSVTHAGRAVTDLQPYLGARGHLVALRDGDLAYRHVHPVDSSANEIAFAIGKTEPDVYRLFLQFRHRGRVHTAAFTR